jgi:hypothetical protein
MIFYIPQNILCDFEEICGNFSTAPFSFILATDLNRRSSGIPKFREQGKFSEEKSGLWSGRGFAGVLLFARNWVERAQRARGRCRGQETSYFPAKFPVVSLPLTL